MPSLRSGLCRVVVACLVGFLSSTASAAEPIPSEPLPHPYTFESISNAPSALVVESLEWDCELCSETLQDGYDNNIEHGQRFQRFDPLSSGLLPQGEDGESRKLVFTAEQYGHDNTIRVNQNGALLRAHVIQDGSYNYAHVDQSGYASVVYLHQLGHHNWISVDQSKLGPAIESLVTVLQDGMDNIADIVQAGFGNEIFIDQNGIGNEVFVSQAGTALRATVLQFGDNLTASIIQR